MRANANWNRQYDTACIIIQTMISSILMLESGGVVPIVQSTLIFSNIIATSETPFPSQLMAQTGIWRGRPLGAVFRGFLRFGASGRARPCLSRRHTPAALPVGYEISTSASASKFHLTKLILDLREYTCQRHSPCRVSAWTGESFLTGSEACFDKRHNRGRSDGRIKCQPQA